MCSSNVRTCDLYLTSALLTLGAEIQSSIRDKKSGRIYFELYSDILDLTKLRIDYFGGSLMVSALKFTDQVKNLKSLCHNLL